MTRPTHRAGLLALMLTMGSTVALAQLPFMRNMYTGPVVLPQVDTRAPVENTIELAAIKRELGAVCHPWVQNCNWSV